MPEEDPRLTPWRKSVYASGDFTVNVALSTMSMVYAAYFLIQVAGLRPEIAAAVQLIGRTVDAFTDPLMGRISDLHRSRWGRRRPFLLLGSIPFGICFALLWADVGSDSQWVLFAYYTVVYVGLSISMTVVSVPYLSMQPELAAGYDARTSLNTYRNVGSLVGFGGGVLFRPVAGALGGGPEGYALAGIGYGVLIALPWFAVVAASWERPDYQRQPVRLSVREAVSVVSRHRTFQRLIGLYLTGRVAIDLAGATLILYFTHVMHRSEDFEPVMLLLLTSVLVSLPFWLHVSKRTEKSTLVIIGAAWWAVCSLILLFAQPDWPRPLMFVFPIVTSIGYAAIDLMPWAMVGEVVDEDELESGQRQEGLYYGVFAFLRKLTGTIAVWVALTLLGVLGLSPGEPANDATVMAIRMLASLGPIAALLLSIHFARAYPLTRGRHDEILEQLAERSRS
jgi:GPH family glycoside/pentoside/hexuronide:cation symporter